MEQSTFALQKLALDCAIVATNTNISERGGLCRGMV